MGLFDYFKKEKNWITFKFKFRTIKTEGYLTNQEFMDVSQMAQSLSLNDGDRRLIPKFINIDGISKISLEVNKPYSLSSLNKQFERLIEIHTYLIKHFNFKDLSNQYTFSPIFLNNEPGIELVGDYFSFSFLIKDYVQNVSIFNKKIANKFFGANIKSYLDIVRENKLADINNQPDAKTVETHKIWIEKTSKLLELKDK